MPLGYGSSLTSFSPKRQLRLRGSSLQRGCLSIGARHHYNAIRETRLCLCKVEPPSGAEGGLPLKSRTPSLNRFLKKFPRQTLSRSDGTFARHPETKSLSGSQRAGRVVRTAYASGLRQLPHHPSPKDGLGSEGFLRGFPRTRQRAQTRKYNEKRLRNTHT